MDFYTYGGSTILITQGSARGEQTDRRLAAALAAIAGAINGAAFQGQLSAASFYVDRRNIRLWPTVGVLF